MNIAMDIENLPTGWTTAALGDHLERITNGLTVNQETEPPGIPVSRIETISDGTINFDKVRYVRDIDKQKREQYLLKSGDILFSHINSDLHLGKTAIYSSNRPLLHGMNLLLLRTRKETLDPYYLHYLLNLYRRQGFFIKIAQHAVNQSSLNQKKITSLKMPLAPLPQQHLIVSEIEKQFSRLDEAVAALKRIKANLKRYKASVLKAAVEGKLTEQWRLSARKRAQVDELENIPKAKEGKWFVYIIECDNQSFYVGHSSDLHARWQAHCNGKAADWTHQHTPKYLIHFEVFDSKEDAVKREKNLKTGFGRTWRKREIAAGRMKPIVHNPENETALPVHEVQTGEKLLKRILAERKKKWEEANPKKKYKEPAPPDTSNLPELPKGWVWSNLEQLAEALPNALKAGPFGSSLKKSYYVPKGYKIYGQEQVLRDDPYFGDYYIDEKRYKMLESCAVKPGDILISLVGTIGRVLILPDKIEAGIINPRLVKLSLDKRLVNAKFIRAYLQSPYVKHLFTLASHGGTMDILNLTILKKIPIPLPPREEQSNIIEEIDRQFSVDDEIEAAIETNLKRAERLRQAILKKAFSGEMI